MVVQTFMEHAGFLVVSDAYHPDWKVTLDGKDWRLFQADYLLRSVFVPQGHHTVRFVFRPFSFYCGSGLTILSFLVFFVLLLYHRLKENKK